MTESATQPMRVLVLGTPDSSRSHMAEGLLRARGGAAYVSASGDYGPYLVRHPGIAVSRKPLLEQVCQEEEGDGRQVDVYIHWLRAKLQDDPAHPEHIQTVRGVGYRFCSK